MNTFFKGLYTILLFIFCGTNCYGQQDTVFIRHDSDWTDDKLNYNIDTVIFETGMSRHILIGTTILPWTHNQEGAKGYGLYFVKVDKSNCQKEEGEYDAKTAAKINSISTTDSTLTIDFNISENCCYSFLCDISVDTKGTLHLLYTGYGTYCFCDCCFGLTYHISKLKGKDIPKIKSVMIMDAQQTIKTVNF